MNTRCFSFLLLAAWLSASAACSSRATIPTAIDAGRSDASTFVDAADSGPTPCTSSRQCPNQVCSTTLSVCVDCNTSVDCTGGQLCHASVCVAPCTSSRQCSAMGQVCDSTLGVCVQCVLDTDCMPGQYCNASQTCVIQVCVPGTTSCTNNTTLQTCDTHGDGYTMSACASGQVCSGTSCMATVCTPGATSCANSTTVNTCNATGLGYNATPCPAMNSCNAGVCTPWTCTPNAMTCASSSEVSVCAANGLTSTTIACMTMDSCSAGACTGWICTPGAMSCASSTMVQTCNMDGLTYTASACPAPANAAAASCASNACGFTCSAGYGNCDGVAANGCEATFATDANNCGSCGHACAAPANASVACVSSTCGFACNAGYADCDHSASNGCESNSATDANNCGGCGHACAAGQTCMASVCVAGPPSSCAQVHAAMPSAMDGSYTLYVAGDSTRPWTAYCYGMSSGTPAEYLTLVNTGASFNFSQNTTGGYYTSPTSVRTTYTRVRIDPVTFAVAIGDQRFSVSTGMVVNASTTVTSMPYGVAGDCSFTGPTGVGNIDLRGTPFSVMPGAFMTGGNAPSGMATYSDSNQVIDLQGSGTCGWIQPLGSAMPPFNMASGSLALVYGT